MKRIFLILSFFCCLIISKGGNSQKFLHEGRTYWYASYFVYGARALEFGVTIGGKETIDGKEWHRIDLTHRYAERYGDSNITGVPAVLGVDTDDTVLPLTYLREENGVIYRGCSSLEEIAQKEVDHYWNKLLNLYYPYDGDFEEYPIIKIGEPGEKLDITFPFYIFIIHMINM